MNIQTHSIESPTKKNSTTQARPQCYGSMYPDLAVPQTNVRQKGQVFETLVESSGIGITSRRYWTKTAEWDRCTECPEYRFCYDLSLAKLLLGGVLEHSGTAAAV
jgi:hypothetical protein